jgi:RNA polymerase sigma-70 factor (ECF subfamily)
MTDGEWVRQSLSGRTDAFERLVRQWAPRVLAVCHARVGRADAAEELAQEAMFRAYKALPTIADPDKFGAWLCGIAVRVCLDWLKSSRRSAVSFSALGDDSTPSSIPDPRPSARDGALFEEEQRQRLMEEVNLLPEKHREVLMLYYYNDCTYAQLAEMLDVSAATINARLTQARMMLRQRLSATGPNSASSPATTRE